MPMERLSILAVIVAGIALLIAMLAFEKAVNAERELYQRRPPAEKVPTGIKKPERVRAAITDADRRRMAVEMRQHANFMNYDGKPQAPIDETTILEE